MGYPTTLQECAEFVSNKESFLFNHLIGRLDDRFTSGDRNTTPTYTVYSYGYQSPIFVYDFRAEKWFGANEKPTSKISELHMGLLDKSNIYKWVNTKNLIKISEQGSKEPAVNNQYSHDKFLSAEEQFEQYIKLHGPIHDYPKPGAHLKKIITKADPDWYFKVIGMLQHNYAFINEEFPGKVMVYFCHEGGRALGRWPKHLVREPVDVDGRLPFIVDSFEFPDVKFAKAALTRNHFSLISELADDSSFDVAHGLQH